MTHSSRKAWKNKILGNDYTKTQPRPQVTADQVAHQLLVTSQGNPDHCSRRAKLPQDAEECFQEPSDLTRPFSIKNLCDGIKIINNNNAAGLDILCGQIDHLGPVALLWLLDMLNCMSTNTFPKLWRKSRVVVMLKPGKDPAIPKSYMPISLLCHTCTCNSLKDSYLLHIYSYCPH